MVRPILTFLAVSAACHAQSEYFPLNVGNQWVYRVSGFLPGEPVVVDVRGTVERGGRSYAVVRGLPEGEALLRFEGNGLLMRADSSGAESVWADFSKPAGATYETAKNPCNKTARVETREGSVKVPAGEFANALILSYPGANCADAGIGDEAYLPYVGLIRASSITIGGPRAMELVYARIGGVTVVGEADLSFTTSIDRTSYRAGDMLRARLALRTPAPLDLEFGSSQRGELVIRNEAGAEVARWSNGRAFAQIFGTERFEPGERNWALEMALRLPAGRYTVEGSLATTGRQRFTSTVGFSVVE